MIQRTSNVYGIGKRIRKSIVDGEIHWIILSLDATRIGKISAENPIAMSTNNHQSIYLPEINIINHHIADSIGSLLRPDGVVAIQLSGGIHSCAGAKKIINRILCWHDRTPSHGRTIAAA